MTIGFFLVDTSTLDSAAGYRHAAALIRSAKAQMPEVPLAQFTDMHSPAAEGVDEVRRLPRKALALLRLQHQAACTGEWLFLDTDVLFQQDVRPVFEQPFDVAVTTRDWPHLKPAVGFGGRMPFNTGVVFSRTHRFWMEVYRRLLLLPDSLQEWMGDQEAIGELVAENEEMRWFNIKHLKGSVYNYPPDIQPKNSEAERLTAAAIVHYKGATRKPMLLERHGRKGAVCA